MEKSKGSTKMKRVEFKSSGKAVAKVNDTDVASNVTLGTYMTLPAEQVSRHTRTGADLTDLCGEERHVSAD